MKVKIMQNVNPVSAAITVLGSRASTDRDGTVYLDNKIARIPDVITQANIILAEHGCDLIQYPMINPIQEKR